MMYFSLCAMRWGPGWEVSVRPSAELPEAPEPADPGRLMAKILNQESPERPKSPIVEPGRALKPQTGSSFEISTSLEHAPQ